MDVDGEYLLVGLQGVGHIGGAQQLTGIELDERVGLVKAALTAFHQQLVDADGVAVAMETHLRHCGCLDSLLAGWTRGASQQQ